MGGKKRDLNRRVRIRDFALQQAVDVGDDHFFRDRAVDILIIVTFREKVFVVVLIEVEKRFERREVIVITEFDRMIPSALNSKAPMQTLTNEKRVEGGPARSTTSRAAGNTLLKVGHSKSLFGRLFHNTAQFAQAFVADLLAQCLQVHCQLLSSCLKF